ncbi:MAG: hydroxysqualene dehydroxylase HpnE [Nocardioidaceae bacterium]
MIGNRVAVVGGGLAGISAASSLADRGWDVTLLESRPRLGGAAYSFNRDGLTVDTGQHVLLRSYQEYRSLLSRLGVGSWVPVQERLAIPVLRSGRQVSWLRRGRRGPAPLHLLPALAGFGALSAADRVRAAWAASRLRKVDPDQPDNDYETFGHWLRRHGQRDEAIIGLWGLICVAALNIEPDQASLALAAKVFRSGLLDEVDAGDIAIPLVPLSDLHDGPARRLLARLGVRCRTGERVTEIAACPSSEVDSGWIVRTRGGDAVVDAVVVAVPHWQASRIVPAAAAPDRDAWAGLGSAPIVNVHVRYDRAVTQLPFAAALGSPIQWIFDRTTASGVDGQYLAMSLSAADDLIERPAEEILRTHLGALSTLLPATRQARLRDAFVTREPRATFRQQAGTGPLRPSVVTRLPGLLLAGAWTATGWPDTMEGAVRSGDTAANVLGSPSSFASADSTPHVRWAST